MTYGAHKGPNVTNYLRELDQGFDPYRQDSEGGYEEELSRFIVPNWSTDAVTSPTAQEQQHGFDDFDLTQLVYNDQSDFLAPDALVDPALQDGPGLNQATSSTQPSLDADLSFFPELASPVFAVDQRASLAQDTQSPASEPNGIAGISPEVQERARRAADEDKRRRNTAASARFRSKKKGQEKQMHQKIQEMAAEIDNLRHEVRKLQVEKKALQDVLALKDGVSEVEDVKHEEHDADKLPHKRLRVNESTVL